MSSKYKIAELIVTMAPEHAPLFPQSKAYCYEGLEESICDLRMTDEIYQSYHARFPGADDPLIEYMATGSFFYHTLIEHSGMLLHASAVELDGKAYLFSAPSGTGKSTHTALWQKEFYPRAQILNDDKPAIRILEDGIFVYGTPWSGKTDLNQNRKVPLQGIAFLERGNKNEIVPLSPRKAIELLLSQTVRPVEKNKMTALLDLISELVQRIPLYQMACTIDPSAAHISYDTMSKGVVK